MMKDCSDISSSGEVSEIPQIDIYFVMSLDGVVALDHDRDISSFSSKEDREFFLDSIKNYDAVIVSSRTYVKDAASDTRRIILTHSGHRDDNPFNTYMSGDIRAICGRMRDMGVRTAALAAGPTTCLSFLRAGVINELYLSIEPVSLGRGIRLFTEEEFISRFELLDMRKLNSEGTVMMRYRVKPDPAP